MIARLLRDNDIARKLWYKLSPAARFNLRKLIFVPLDTWEKLTGKTHKYVPSRGAVFTGGTASAVDFVTYGRQQLVLLKKYAGLTAQDNVLDIGCGVGRTAIAFTEFLEPAGSYKGFDVVKKGINWCQSGIGKDFSNFEFKHVPLFNDLYTQGGTAADSFKFPYADNSFDTIFSFSVFTHMGIAEIQNYLKEMNRTRRQNAVCFSTFFVYNDDNEHHISTKNGFKFPVKKEGYRLMSNSTVSGNIAIHESLLATMVTAAGFTSHTIIYGFWNDATRGDAHEEYQDIVVLQ